LQILLKSSELEIAVCGHSDAVMQTLFSQSTDVKNISAWTKMRCGISFLCGALIQ